MLKNLVKDLKPSSTLKINEVSKHLENQGKKICGKSREEISSTSPKQSLRHPVI